MCIHAFSMCVCVCVCVLCFIISYISKEVSKCLRVYTHLCMSECVCIHVRTHTLRTKELLAPQDKLFSVISQRFREGANAHTQKKSQSVFYAQSTAVVMSVFVRFVISYYIYTYYIYQRMPVSVCVCVHIYA